MNHHNFPRIPPQPPHQLPLTNLQLGTDLIKATHAVQVLDQRPIIDDILLVLSVFPFPVLAVIVIVIVIIAIDRSTRGRGCMRSHGCAPALRGRGLQLELGIADA